MRIVFFGDIGDAVLLKNNKKIKGTTMKNNGSPTSFAMNVISPSSSQFVIWYQVQSTPNMVAKPNNAHRIFRLRNHCKVINCELRSKAYSTIADILGA